MPASAAVAQSPLQHNSTASASSASLQSVSDKIDFNLEEQEILALWNRIKAFETSLQRNKDCPVFTFYDGPPFATGLPHYGHLLAGTIKDIVTRYAQQTGHYVERRFGWLVQTCSNPFNHNLK
jgi:isoleucyl-tRNA synthetase